MAAQERIDVASDGQVMSATLYEPEPALQFSLFGILKHIFIYCKLVLLGDGACVWKKNLVGCSDSHN